jgi:hypothetical protein
MKKISRVFIKIIFDFFTLTVGVAEERSLEKSSVFNQEEFSELLNTVNLLIKFINLEAKEEKATLRNLFKLAKGGFQKCSKFLLQYKKIETF